MGALSRRDRTSRRHVPAGPGCVTTARATSASRRPPAPTNGTSRRWWTSCERVGRGPGSIDCASRSALIASCWSGSTVNWWHRWRCRQRPRSARWSSLLGAPFGASQAPVPGDHLHRARTEADLAGAVRSPPRSRVRSRHVREHLTSEPADRGGLGDARRQVLVRRARSHGRSGAADAGCMPVRTPSTRPGCSKCSSARIAR